MIRKIRCAIGDNQKMFASRLDIKQPLVSRWEGDESDRTPSVKAAQKIIKVTVEFGVKINIKTGEVIITSKKNGFRNVALDDIYA